MTTVPEKSIHIDCDISEYMMLQETEERRLYLNGTILPLDEYNIYAPEHPIASIKRNIRRFNREDTGLAPEKRKPIILYIDSPGGNVVTGMSLVDTIKDSITPVYTVNDGQWSSMAFLIGIAGKKRYSLSSSIFLLHDGSIYVGGSSNKVYDQAKFEERYENEKIRKHVLECSRLSAEEYDQKTRIEWHMTAEEAKEYGFIDEIVTDINSIL